jgi:glutamate 5-kinase
MQLTIVVKIGSLGVSHLEGGVSPEKVQRLSRDLESLKTQGHRLILVSSGAINAGKKYLAQPADKHMRLAWQQACAAVGMPLLMQEYQLALQKYKPAQVLVTHEDFKQRNRFLNIRNTLFTLMENGHLPIINENDTVSTQEISVGDNDQLAAMVAEAIDADRLILLTDADGLYDRHPQDPQARHFSRIDFQEDFRALDVSGKTGAGRGGMFTKLQAVRRLTPLGLDVTIASFHHEAPVTRALNGAGTLFVGDHRQRVKKRLAWIASVAKPDCALIVDEGASLALKRGQASLLPIGVKKIQGQFKRGDIVAVKYKQSIIAKGIVEYDAKEVLKIAGKKSSELTEILADVPSLVVIHKDNLFLLKA